MLKVKKEIVFYLDNFGAQSMERDGREERKFGTRQEFAA